MSLVSAGDIIVLGCDGLGTPRAPFNVKSTWVVDCYDAAVNAYKLYGGPRNLPWWITDLELRANPYFYNSSTCGQPRMAASVGFNFPTGYSLPPLEPKAEPPKPKPIPHYTEVIARYGKQQIPDSVVAAAIDRGETTIRRRLRVWPDGQKLHHETELSDTQMTISWYFTPIKDPNG